LLKCGEGLQTGLQMTDLHTASSTVTKKTQGSTESVTHKADHHLTYNIQGVPVCHRTPQGQNCECTALQVISALLTMLCS
jgi:hypothetical protein